MIHIESLLSARLFLSPQQWEKKLYFISNMSGRFSLYSMNLGGSVPDPLLPPQIAMPNPDFVNVPYAIFPELGKILVMLDDDGDENYLPKWIPMKGGIPELAFEELKDYRVEMGFPDQEKNVVYFHAQSRTEAMNYLFRADLKQGTLEKIDESVYGAYIAGVNEAGNAVILIDGYSPGDTVMFLKRDGEDKQLIYGKPMEDRAEGEDVPLNSLGASFFQNNDSGILVTTSLFEDTYGLGYIDLSKPQAISPISIVGLQHSGAGEMIDVEHLVRNSYKVKYNIDGVSWLYEGSFDGKQMNLETVLVGEGVLSNGVLQASYFHKPTESSVLCFSTATSPAQIYTISQDHELVSHTHERILGISKSLLSSGEDASFNSHDGLRISARLYMPAEELGFTGKRPLVYYIHGGPQSQEKPDFTWFSMPLIQFLTLNGFAVFVPNVRGSTGYGLSYMKHVDRDWGGQDRLDHVHAMTQVLPNDERIDTTRASVIGRSYGGYMTLTLAGRHPELWKAAVDMFGPYDLFTFMDRIPATWKPYFHLVLGHPDTDHDFLVDRSPKTHIHNLACPMLVIQGKNDPRVVEQESSDVVNGLREQGKDIEYIVFENEGHDVIKFENKVRCYNAINDFFVKHLQP